MAVVVEEDLVLQVLLAEGPKTVQELTEACSITATAVRHHLNRLMARGLVERRQQRYGRGRPRHVYFVPSDVRSELGNNFTDLAIALWNEIDAQADRPLAIRLLKQVGDRLGRTYRALVSGRSLAERLGRLVALFRRRGILAEMATSTDGSLALRLLSCPYQQLADGDRKVCGIERRVLSTALDANVRLTQCRLNGARCCEFEVRECAAGR